MKILKFINIIILLVLVYVLTIIYKCAFKVLPHEFTYETDNLAIIEEFDNEVNELGGEIYLKNNDTSNNEYFRGIKISKVKILIIKSKGYRFKVNEFEYEESVGNVTPFDILNKEISGWFNDFYYNKLVGDNY